MPTIFVNLGKRNGDEIFPSAPFRAFAKLKTWYVREGGMAVLPLTQNNELLGTATIDWGEADHRRDQNRMKYLVADGSLEEVHGRQLHRFTEREQIIMVQDAMKKDGWKYEEYDPTLNVKVVKKRFAKWIDANL